ncbi:hypothetical protein OG21DRAFT_1425564, partial [Imleria badia]
GVAVLLVSLEQLTLPLFKSMIDSSIFKMWVCMMAINEAHLMNTWEVTFHKDY